MIPVKAFTLHGGCSHSNHRQAIIPVFLYEQEDEYQFLKGIQTSSPSLLDATSLLLSPTRTTTVSSSVLPGLSPRAVTSDIQKKYEALPKFIDSHCHLVNFVQDLGDGGIQELLKQMDKAGVEQSVLLGLGVCKKWSRDDLTVPTYYTDDDSKCYFYGFTDQIVLDAILTLPLSDQKRFAPLIGGINPTDMHSIKHIKRMYEKAPHLWRGVGELLLRHDDLTSLTVDQEAARPDHPALQPIFNFLVEKNLPVLIHSNCSNISLSRNPDDTMRYIEEMAQCVRNNPKLTIVWAHCGASRRVGNSKLYVAIDQLLSDCNNLHVDISWVVLEDEIMDPNNRCKPRQVWVDVIEKHSDRVLVGSDIVAAYGSLEDNLRRYAFLLAELKQSTAIKITRTNAQRIFFPHSFKESNRSSIPTNLERPTARVIPVSLPDGSPATFIWGQEALKVFANEEYIIRENGLPQQFQELVALGHPIVHGLDGKEHKRVKDIVMLAHETVFAFQHIGAFSKSIEPKVEELALQIFEAGKPIEVKLIQFLNDIHINAVFPAVCSAKTHAKEFDNSVLLQTSFSAGPGSAAYPPACKAAKEFDKYWSEKNATSKDTEDILGLLKSGGLRSDDELIPEVNVSAFAFIQNVGKGVGNTIVSILTHPAIHKRLMDELRNHADDIHCSFSYPLLCKLPLLVRVVQETLRRYSLISRNQGLANKDFVLENVYITKGTPVLASWFHTNQDPKVYENPNEWNPDRFPDHMMEATDYWNESYTWTPFGAGPRSTTHKCPAIRTAFSLICFYVATLLTAFEIKMKDPTRTINEAIPGATPFDDLPVFLSLPPGEEEKIQKQKQGQTKLEVGP